MNRRLITGGDIRALNELQRDKQAMLAGGQYLSGVELAQVLLQLNQVLTGIEAQTEAVTKLTERIVQQEERQRRLEAQMERIVRRSEERSENFSPEQKERARAKLANRVAQEAQNVRAKNAADAILLKHRLSNAPHEDYFWPLEDTFVQFGAIRYEVKGGRHNRLPVPVTRELRRRLIKMKEQEARKSILKVGRRSDGRQMLSKDEVDYWLKEIDRKFGVKSGNDSQVETVASAI